MHVSANICRYLKEENSKLQEDLDKANAKVYTICEQVIRDEAVLFFQILQEKK